MKFLSILVSLQLILTVHCRNALWDRVDGRDMNARDLVGLANEHRGLDFDINAHQSAGLSSDRENVLALGTENKKRVVVDGVTHDNENIRIEEGHVNKFKFNPLSLPKLGSNHPVDHFLSTLKSIDYENSKTTNLQVGDKTIQERKHNDIVSDVLSGPGKFFFG